MALTVNDVALRIDARVLCGDADKVFDGVYVGDFLSRAMSRVEFDNIWVTIMSNVNVIAVATLTEPAAIILAEGVVPADDVLENAIEQGVCVLSSPLSAYEICVKINKAVEECGV